MSLPVVFHPKAATEFEEAVDWYDEQRMGLGSEFKDSIDATLKAVREDPDRQPEIFKGARRWLAERFPYKVIYKIENDRILVVAVFHSKRNPKVWQSRIRSGKPDRGIE